jgi:RNA polymerase-interacting CarD/CdnL/TRCF family regulator
VADWCSKNTNFNLFTSHKASCRLERENILGKGNSKKFRVGSKIVDNGQVFTVFKIHKKKDDRGEIERILHYKPYFKRSENNLLKCSIPEKNLKQANIRDPVSKQEIDEILKKLRKKIRPRNPVDAVAAKTKLKHNNIHTTAGVLKRFWKEKKRKGDSLSKTQRDIFDNALNKIVEEVAIVKGIKLEKAEEKLRLALEG